jgi:hypothetical protein
LLAIAFAAWRPVSAVLSPRASTAIPLLQRRCARGVTGVANVSEVIVRFHVLGREERQRLALGTPLALHCP